MLPCTTEEMNTKELSYLMYDRISWKLKIRKEVKFHSCIESMQCLFSSFTQVFSPTETFNEPVLCDLLYFQIVADTFSSKSIRILDTERMKMREYLGELK